MASFEEITQALNPLNDESLTFEELSALPFSEIDHMLNGSLARHRAKTITEQEREYLASIRNRIDALDVLFLDQEAATWQAVDKELNKIYNRITSVVGSVSDEMELE